MERLVDGSSVFLNAEAESKAARKHEISRQNCMEDLYIKYQKEFEHSEIRHPHIG